MKRLLPAALAVLSLLAVPMGAPARAQAPAAKPAAKPADVYDESADANQDVAAALARAKRENRRVLIQWGANWCGWCRLLHGTMATDADLRRELLYEYDVVLVDVGRGGGPGFTKNMDLAAKLGAVISSVPYLTILDADGKPLIQQETEPFEVETDGKHGHDPKKLVDFLKQHQATPLAAETVRADALAAAKAQGKRLFLHFGAPWCGWCHHLERWLAQPEVSALIGKDFVDCKIDQDRMVGGKELIAAELARAGSEAGGIPWFVFLDAEGKLLATSDRPVKTKDGKDAKENVGFPSSEEEIGHFLAMLEAARVNLKPADLETLRASLVANREAREAAAAKGLGGAH